MFTRRLLDKAFSTLQAQAIVGDASTGLTAAGTNQGTALALVSPVSVFTTVASGTGCILPAGLQVGDRAQVFNGGANSLTIYPPSGGAINGQATNAGLILPPGQCVQLQLFSTDGLTWATANAAGPVTIQAKLTVNGGTGVGGNASFLSNVNGLSGILVQNSNAGASAECDSYFQSDTGIFRIQVLSSALGSGNTNLFTQGASNTLSLGTNSIMRMVIGAAGTVTVNPASSGYSLAVDGASALNFIGTGATVAGDMSNATVASRLTLQTSTTNGNTFPQLVPNGTATSSKWNFFNSSTLTVTGVASVGIDNTNTFIDSSNIGGTTLPLAFRVGGTNRGTVGVNGNWSLSAPTSAGLNTLTVTANTSQYAGVFNGASGGGPGLYAQTSAAGLATAALVLVKFDNNTTTSNAIAQFYVNAAASGSGQINANGVNSAAFGAFSDARLKENILDLPPMLERILALRPRSFDYISVPERKIAAGHQWGFIAQEVRPIFPDAVGEDESGYLTLTGLGKTEAIFVRAIQELAMRVAQLEQRATSEL